MPKRFTTLTDDEIVKDELEAGDTAGLEHYRRAGEMLLEAREQVAAFKWGGGEGAVGQCVCVAG